MKLLLSLATILFICMITHAQTEGQDFCADTANGDYFPLTIEKKKIVWYDTFYTEEQTIKKKIKDRTYIEYLQTWKDGSIEKLYLREESNKILQYEECCDSETIRFEKDFKLNQSWTKANNSATYSLISTSATLITPYCNYTNLIAIRAEFKKITYVFYYQRGYGYVGATVKDKLVSYATPEW